MFYLRPCNKTAEDRCGRHSWAKMPQIKLSHVGKIARAAAGRENPVVEHDVGIDVP